MIKLIKRILGKSIPTQLVFDDEEAKRNKLRKKYETIIVKWLNIRDDVKTKYWMSCNESEHNLPRYVVRMISELNMVIPNSTFDEIRLIEGNCMGYSDYVQKFTLRLVELYEQKEKEQQV